MILKTIKLWSKSVLSVMEKVLEKLNRNIKGKLKLVDFVDGNVGVPM